MQFLHAHDVPEQRAIETFRHGTLAPCSLAVALLAPCAVLVALSVAAAPTVRALSPFVSIPVAVLAAGIGFLLMLCVEASIGVARASLRSSNWVMRLVDDGVFLKLRSYQNHSFPDDGPTVAFVPFARVASVREVSERFERTMSDDRATHTLRWIELAVDPIDTAPLAQLVEHERTRRAPGQSFLRVRWSSRSHHVPVFVPSPGVIRVERVSGKMLCALEQHVTVSLRREIDLDAGDPPFDERLRAFVERGETMAAVDFARRTRGLSLTDARELVDRCSGRAA